MDQLRFDVPDEKIKWKIQAISGNKALVVPYIDARAVIEVLNDKVGGDWSDEIIKLEPTKIIRGQGDKAREGYYCLIKLTVKGVHRFGVGEGEFPKDAESDALKRAALKFGIGLNLYEGNKVWADTDGRNITTPREDLFAMWRGEKQVSGPRPVSNDQPRQQSSSSDDFDCNKLSGREASEKQRRAIWSILVRKHGLEKDAANDMVKWLLDGGDAKDACEAINNLQTKEGFDALYDAFLAETVF